MEYIAELHTHSKYAGACSEQLTLENMDAAALTKGLNILLTGDFTHPLWFKDIKNRLIPSEEMGLYRLKGSKTGTKFIIGGEIATIFNKSGSGKAGVFDATGNVSKVHHVVLVPNIETAEQINETLGKLGNLAIDGRPQLNMSASDLVETLRKVSKEVFVFPAHVWTPWFGVLGSFSGYDSIKEAYEDQAQHIHALETGLSSDPVMNWRVSELDNYALLSGGDAHSIPKLGREATLFDIAEKNLSYDSIIYAIKNKQIKGTVEFYPEEGKYHYDGHRKCSVSLSPEQARKYNGICPVCRKRLTIGVLHRVEELADREEGFVPDGAAPFVHAIPLIEVIAFVKKKSTGSVYVAKTYNELVKKFGNEMNVLLKSTVDDIKHVDKELGRAIENMREDKVHVVPGYDGVFGIIDIANSVKEARSPAQRTMSEF